MPEELTSKKSKAPLLTETLDENIPYWLAFNAINIISLKEVKLLISRFGSPSAAWNACGNEIALVLSKKKNLKVFFEKRSSNIPKECAQEITNATKNNISILTVKNPKFPIQLLEISNPPLVLYIKGTIQQRDKKSISIVGTRNASYYGRRKARELARELAKNGYTIVSGLARGIDTEAHIGALEAGGRTIAVLANGLASIYPPENEELANDIVSHGCILSESPLCAKPKRWRLRQRNRLISGLSLASIVIEGGERTGTSIVIKNAMEQGRRIFAVRPEDENRSCAQLPLKLIRDGSAIPILSVKDVLKQSEIGKKYSVQTRLIENDSTSKEI